MVSAPASAVVVSRQALFEVHLQNGGLFWRYCLFGIPSFSHLSLCKARVLPARSSYGSITTIVFALMLTFAFPQPIPVPMIPQASAMP